MTRIPRSREVDKALRAALGEVKSALKELNLQAGQTLSRGHYESAQGMVDVGRTLSAFQTRLEGVLGEWRSLRPNSNKGAGGDNITPLWNYYTPILQALSALGGSASRKEIEATLESSLLPQLLAGDTDQMARGVPRWKVMIRRARPRMIQEGFLEDGSGAVWKITPTGRRAAESNVN